MPDLWDKLVVALDLDQESQIKEIIGQLSSKVKKFKIGPVAFTRFGPKAIDWAKEKKADVFLDFKFYDIPNTMIESAKALVDLGVWAFTVHLKSGRQSLSLLNKEVSEYARRKDKQKPLIFGVTELTSENASSQQVLNLAKAGKAAGVEGIVCSVWETEEIKRETGLLAVTPGIRPTYISAGEGKSIDDQKRKATLKQAIEAGSDYFVVGRPIVKSDNPLSAAESLIIAAENDLHF